MILSGEYLSTLFRGWRFLLPLVLLTGGAVQADDVFLKSGFILEGKLIRRTKYRLYLQTVNGVQCIPLIRVAKVVKKKWLVNEFVEGLAKEKEKHSPESMSRFYEWAMHPDRVQKLRKYLPELFRLMVRIVPEHEESRRRLGHVKVKGEWLDPDEAKRKAVEEEQRRQSRSWAEYEREKKRRDSQNQQAAKWGGRFLGEQINMNRKSDEQGVKLLSAYIGKKVTCLSSTRISIRGFVSEKEAEQLLDLGERALTSWGSQLYGQVSLNPFGGTGTQFIFYAVRRKDLGQMVEYVADIHGGMSSGDRRFYTLWGMGIPPNGWDHLTVRLLDEGGFSLRQDFTRDLARSWCEAASGARLAPWLPAGFALEAARRFLGSDRPVTANFKLDGIGLQVGSAMNWLELAQTLGRVEEDPPLAGIMRREKSGLTFFDLGKTMGLVSMLWDRDPRRLGMLFSALSYKHGTQSLALMNVYGKKPESFDLMFREWAKK